MSETVERKKRLLDAVQTVNNAIVPFPEFEGRATADSAVIARVRFAAGATLKVGNFEMLRVDVGIDLPVEVRAVDAGYRAASEWVADRLCALALEHAGRDV